MGLSRGAPVVFAALLSVGAAFVAGGCDAKSTDATSAGAGAELFSIEGLAQKGPLSVGATVTVQELTPALEPAGKTYVTTTSNDLGAFRLATHVGSPSLEIIADGPFYDELRPHLAQERIALHAFVHPTVVDAGVAVVNVNLLTHLQSARLKSLVGSGQPFASAEAQSKSDVLAALGLPSFADPAGGLSIVGTADADAELLAMSILVENAAGIVADHYGELPGVPEFVGALRADLEDGSLDTPRLVEAFARSRKLLAQGVFGSSGVATLTTIIDDGLRSYYAERGVAVIVPDWRKFFPPPAVAAPADAGTD